MAKGFRHGSGGEARKVPVLDEAYPQDVSVDAAGTEVTFEAVIAEDGKPVGYTYQWYYDNSPVEGETGATYTRPAEFGSHSVYCIVTSMAGFVTSRTATVTAKKVYLYNKGNESGGITGGWTLSGTGTKGSGSIRVGRTSNASATFNATCTTKNAVDFTPYKTLTVHITAMANNGGMSTAYIYVLNSNGTKVATVTLFTGDINSTNITKTIDVSAMKNGHKVQIAVSMGNTSSRYAYVTYDIVSLA